MSVPQNVQDVVLWAWVGEDEHGSGEVGIKQALCPAGYIPLVACKDGKINQDYLREQLQQQANAFGKTIRLCKFTFVQVEETLEPQNNQ